MRLSLYESMRLTALTLLALVSLTGCDSANDDPFPAESVTLALRITSPLSLSAEVTNRSDQDIVDVKIDYEFFDANSGESVFSQVARFDTVSANSRTGKAVIFPSGSPKLPTPSCYAYTLTFNPEGRTARERVTFDACS
jgi:hypothetical protein